MTARDILRELDAARRTIADVHAAFPDLRRVPRHPVLDRLRGDLDAWRQRAREEILPALDRIRAAERAILTLPSAAVVVSVACPEPAAHTGSPTWDPRRRGYSPRQPTAAMVHQVRHALADAHNRPPQVMELTCALMAAVGCSRATAYRGIAAARVDQVIRADARNRVLPGPRAPADTCALVETGGGGPATVAAASA